MFLTNARSEVKYEGGPSQALLAGGQGPPPVGFNHIHRPKRDTLFSTIFLLLVAGSIGLGVYAAIHADRDFLLHISDGYLSKKSNCPAPWDAEPAVNNATDAESMFALSLIADEEAISRAEFEKFTPSVGDGFVAAFLSLTGSRVPSANALGKDGKGQLLGGFAVPLAFSIVAAFLAGTVFLTLLSSAPKTMVYLAIIVQVALPILVGVTFLSNEMQGPGYVFLGFGIVQFVFWSCQGSRLSLTANLIEISAKCFKANAFSFIFLTLFMQLVLLLVFIGYAVLMLLSYMNGYVVPNSALEEGGGKCGLGPDLPLCCSWEVPPLAITAFAVTSFTFAWCILLIGCISFYTVAGCTAQWYFSPPQAPFRKGSVWVSLGHALGPSFGSLCFASLVLWIVQAMRSATESARKKREDDFIVNCFAYIMECFYNIIEFCNKFTIVWMSISGDGFIEGSMRMVSLLVRNALSIVVVDSVANWVMNFTTFLISVLWGGFTYFFFTSYWSTYPLPGFSPKDAPTLAMTVGVASFVVVIILLGAISKLLINILESAYICYAMDKDAGTISNRVAYEAYSQVPSTAPSKELETKVMALPAVYYALPAAPLGGQPYPHAQPYPQIPPQPFLHPGV